MTTPEPVAWINCLDEFVPPFVVTGAKHMSPSQRAAISKKYVPLFDTAALDAARAQARKDALEEAAKVADKYEPASDWFPHGCADAIRALLDRKGEAA